MSKEFVLKNVSEELVALYIDDCMKKSNICRCPRCRADVLAIALNTMPAQYVVTSEGDLYVRTQLLSQQYRVDVIAAITKGIMIVDRDPRHDEGDLDRSLAWIHNDE